MGIDVSFFSSGYLDVSVHRVPLHTLWIHAWIRKVSLRGFPHSDISGSLGICPSPKLFAAYHVFHRLSVPRHPPCALSCMTSFFRVGAFFGFPPLTCLAWHGLVFSGLFFSFVVSKCFFGCLFAASSDVFSLLFENSLILRMQFSRCFFRLLQPPKHQSLLILRPLDKPSFLFLAATYSPTSSPMQYHRPTGP